MYILCTRYGDMHMYPAAGYKVCTEYLYLYSTSSTLLSIDGISPCLSCAWNCATFYVLAIHMYV